MIVLPLLLLLLLVSIIAVIIGVPVAAKQASRRRKLTGPVCGNCHYSVTGLTKMTCPECGGDLRIAGVVTPSSPQGGGVVMALMIFTFQMAFIAIVATCALQSVVPVRRSYSRQVQLGPVSSGYRIAVVRTSRTSWGGNFTPAAVEIELRPSGATPTAPRAQMTVDANGRYELTAGSRVPGRGEFGERAVLEWLKALSVDTTGADIQQKATRIAAEVRIAAHSGRAAMQMSSRGGTSSSSSGGNPSSVFQNRSSSEFGESSSPVAALIAMILFWIAIWICGVWYLAIRKTRRGRE